MPEILLKTKLCQPLLRTEIIPRPLLLERLGMGLINNGIFQRKLTLVSAPAGYGKTTLVAQWLKESGLPTCWLSLDEDDNDPTRFLTYLIAAIRTVHAGMGKVSEAMLQSPQPPPNDILLGALVNEIEATQQPIVLTIDDYHLIRTPAIHQQLTYVLDHQPANLHLVIATREDPLLPVARLRARAEVQEIRQHDLRFTSTETVSFLVDGMKLGLSADDATALEHRTEGWVAGLQLAALSMRDRQDLTGFIQAFTGSSRFILDYLIEEVFERQSPDVKEFLLKTSILQKLSGPLCDSLTGRDDSQDLIESIEQANLFIIPLDQSRTWYRYHHLFAELLRHRLRKAGKIDEKGLHTCASQWYASQNMPEDAIRHAIQAQDWEHAGEVLSSINTQMLKNGQYLTLVGWYQHFPEEFLISNPEVCFGYCWPLLLAGNFETALPLLTHVEKQAQGNPEFLGEVMAAQAYLARGQGNHPLMIERSQRALELLSKDSVASRGIVAVNLGLAYWHMGQMLSAEQTLNEALEAGQAVGNHYAALTALIFIGRTCAAQRCLRQAENHFLNAIDRGEDIPINCLSYLDMAALHYEWNNLEKSEAFLQRAMALCERNRSEEFQVANLMMQTRLHIAREEFESASQMLEYTVEKIHAENIPIVTAGRIPSLQAQLALAKGNLTMARDFVEQSPDNIDSHHYCRFLGITKAQVYIACGESDRADAYLSSLYNRAKDLNLGYGQIVIRVLQAVASGVDEQSIAYLREALTMAQGEGFLRAFIDTGDGLIPLLHEVARQGVAPDYIGRILSSMNERSLKTSLDHLSLVEPLSQREIEVLRLVTAGLSNREIAEKLIISPGTAKTHIHNLCGKLGVRNRTEAAIRAKELNLV